MVGYVINGYRFGYILINGVEYTSDVKILHDHIVSNWWRKEGHKLSVDDIKDILMDPPEVIIIGTGSSGAMKVPESIKQIINEKGIELIIETTKIACEKFNEMSVNKKVATALHLTC